MQAKKGPATCPDWRQINKMTKGAKMTPADDKQTPNKPKAPDTDKTVVLQRCAKHGTVFMPDEGCPECQKEKNAPKS